MTPVEEDGVDEMLIGLLTAVALVRDKELVVLIALTLVGEVEALEVVVSEEVEVATLTLIEDEDAVPATTKISFCAPATHPIPALYPGLTPAGGLTLSPVA
jgi:hypothetical protein